MLPERTVKLLSLQMDVGYIDEFFRYKNTPRLLSRLLHRNIPKRRQENSFTIAKNIHFISVVEIIIQDYNRYTKTSSLQCKEVNYKY